MKTIAFLTPFVDNRGGGEVFLDNLVNYCNENSNEWKMVVFTADKSVYTCKTVDIPAINTYKKLFSHFLEICRIIDAYGYDYLILNDIYLSQFSLFFSLRLRNVYCLIHGEIDYIPRSNRLMQRIVTCFRLRFISIGSKKILSVNKHNCDLYHNKQMVVKIGNFIMPSNVDSSNENKEYDFVFCGRFVSLKRIDLIVDSFRVYREKYNENSRLLLIGAGECYSAIQEKIKQMCMQQYVDMPGYVEHKQIVSYYLKSKCLLLFSETEGFPTVMLEALQLGLPCIVTDVGSNSEVIKDGINGYCFPLGTEIEEIANLMHNSLSIDSYRCKESVNKYAISCFLYRFIESLR